MESEYRQHHPVHRPRKRLAFQPHGHPTNRYGLLQGLH